MEILKYRLNQLPKVLLEESLALQKATWPAMEVDQYQFSSAQMAKDRAIAFLAMDKKLVGYGEIFPRIINTTEGPLEIWGLASVCVTKSRRGAGIGRLVVDACFREVDHIPNGISLFQTGAPPFYEKLNCLVVHNQFTNSQDQESPEKNPFWDDHTMIYPAYSAWPNGPIDLNGKGY